MSADVKAAAFNNPGLLNGEIPSMQLVKSNRFGK